MKGNESRGIVLAAIAVLVGGLILWAGFDSPDVSSAQDDLTVTNPDPDPAPGTEEGGDDEGAGDSTAPVPTEEPTFTLRPPADVRVLVANAAGIDGAAGRGKDTLVANGYNALPPTDSTVALTVTAIYWNDGYEGDAREIARILGGTPDQLAPWPASPPVADPADANILVVLGSDLASTG